MALSEITVLTSAFSILRADGAAVMVTSCDTAPRVICASTVILESTVRTMSFCTNFWNPGASTSTM